MDTQTDFQKEKLTKATIHRADLSERLTAAPEGLAWVVNIFTNEDNSNFFPELEEKLSENPEFDALSDLKRAELIQETLRQAFKNNGFPGVLREQNLAFSSLELAQIAADYFQGTDVPILLPISEIRVQIDKFKDEVLDGKRPFIVMLEKGNVFEVWGHQSPDYMAVYCYEDPVYEPKAKHLTVTVWALDQVLATQEGIKEWNNLKRKQVH